MSCKLLLVICAVICVVGSLEAASVRIVKNADKAVHKLDYEEVHANVRGSRQAQEEDVSGEDSDEDDDEDDAEQLQQHNIRQQQAQEQASNDSQEGSNEDDEEDDEENDDDDDDSFFGRRLKRDVPEPESANEIESVPKPIVEADKEKEEESSASTDATTAAPSAPAAPNTSVLILIRDAIKKVTTELPKLPNTQQVATSAQQYFQLFEHFLQQTIEQVIGDDDEEDEVESTTVAPESSPESAAAEGEKEGDKESETSDKKPETESTDKETTAVVAEVPVAAENKPETVVSPQVDATKA